MTTAAAIARARQTFRWDLTRAPGTGILESIWQTFALVIAIRAFQAPDTLKAMVPAAFSFGLLLTPLSIALVRRSSWRLSKLVALYAACAGACLLVAWQLPVLGVYVAAVFLAQFFIAQGAPLMTHIYANNYLSGERGRRFALMTLVASLFSALFAWFGGWILDLDPETIGTWPWILFAGVLACALMTWTSHKIPSEPASAMHVGNPWQNLSLIWQDKVFGWLLFAWMLMGLGNLMMLPLRAEYIANPVYGIDASNATIGLILGTIPFTCRLLATPLWGFLFDRMNLVTVRVILNCFFFASIALYFTTTNLVLMGVAMGLLGAAFGGGRIMWTLWVTKISPPEKTSAYMSIHSGLTGVRGAIAPFLGYFLIVNAAPSMAAWIACCLLGASTIMFLPFRPILEHYRTAQGARDR